MSEGRSIFSRLTGLLPLKPFARCVQRYQGERYVRFFSCMDQYLSGVFAQFTQREIQKAVEHPALGRAIRNRGTPTRTPRERSSGLTEPGKTKECTETWNSGQISAGEY
jgi:hypothetical protein